jgi:hypothetical protein
MPKQLSIIVIGSSHANFTLYPVLKKIFKQLCSQRIPCSYMQEGPSDRTLKTEIESTMRGLRQNQLVKKIAPRIADYYVKDEKSLHPYLIKANWNSIEEIVKEKFMPLLGKDQHNIGMLKQIVLELYRESAYLEEIEFYKILEQLDVHFAGLDAPTSTYNEQIIASSSSEDAYYHNESIRISTMVSNFFQHITERFSNGGIVLVFTGTNHAQRLAANLLQYSREDQFNSTNIEINLHVFKIHSSYEKKWSTDHEYALELTAPLDSTEIKEIYKSLPCTDIECKENKNACSIPELESLVNKLVKQYTQAVTKSTAPSQSIFSPLPPHDQLVNDIKDYLKQTSLKVNDTFMTAIEEKRNYSLALRNACAWGNYDLVKILIRYSNTLPFELNETSSNGNTPLMWFEASKASNEEKMEIKAMLQSRMELSSLSQNTLS